MQSALLKCWLRVLLAVAIAFAYPVVLPAGQAAQTITVAAAAPSEDCNIPDSPTTLDKLHCVDSSVGYCILAQAAHLDAVLSSLDPAENCTVPIGQQPRPLLPPV
jgi:hypothetical protein